jgi:light-regulated signal transduction histidine kinase (bacteriophytochrome)
VNLTDVVNAARAELEPEIAGRDIRWSISALPLVFGDPALLHLAVSNLLSNAIKYTRRAADASISVGGFPGSHTDDVTIRIRDNGVGFAESAAGKLFGVFQRLHADEEFEGTGIGLANVRRIVARHGGRVWAEGRPGDGATFFFSLPAVPPVSSSEGAVASPSQSA